MNKIDVLLGLQWGDEGKGKIVDMLAPQYDVIARFQGGANAGHSLEFNGKKHVLHLIPSGIFHQEKMNIIGNGVVFDPVAFEKEIYELEVLGLNPTHNLKISGKAHLILPTHRLLDQALESNKGGLKIGSTLKGIGPAYTDKTGRNGLRVGDVLLPDFEERYKKLLTQHRALLTQYNFELINEISKLETEWVNSLVTLKRFDIIDSEYYINEALHAGRRILAEGAQGSLLDVDFGSYPFVTSSNTVSASACIGLGISPSRIGRVFGVAKAYCTRVGNGPFSTELFDQMGDLLREKGAEFGATTGRPRRCGWLDLIALKYTVMINGVTDIVLTKADVLSGFDHVNICTAYNINGETLNKIPLDHFAKIEPLYTPLKGWKADISKIRIFDDLPQEFTDYVRFIEKETNVNISIISVGPDRNATIIR